MLKRKRRSSSGSQAPAPEERSERGSPVEQLRERSREGRKETIRKAEYENPEGRHGKPGRREGGKRRSESGSAAPGKPLRGRNGKNGKEETEG